MYLGFLVPQVPSGETFSEDVAAGAELALVEVEAGLTEELAGRTDDEATLPEQVPNALWQPVPQ